jgi:hypothetical protein
MEYIRITSRGEIDERSFSLIGATNKRNVGSKIGMFGSGLKYSLAFLLKNQINFRVFSGYREIKFEAHEEDFRGVPVKRIHVNGEKTSLSTDMGMDWTHWFVLREIYCNALDESDADISLIEGDVASASPVEDCTVFYIEMAEGFKSVFSDWNQYFSDKRTDLLWHDIDGNQLYVGGQSSLVYRKGIRCFHSEEPSLFHYDLNWVQINESRVIANDWAYKYQLVKFLKKISDHSIVFRIIHNINEYQERDLSWGVSDAFSDEYLKVIGDKYVIPFETAGFWEEEIKELKGKHVLLPNTMVRALQAQFGDEINVIGQTDANTDMDIKIVDEVGKRESHVLSEAVAFLKKAGYEIQHPIKVAKFSKDDTLGLAKDDTIFVANKVLSVSGVRKTAAIIIEENEHLNSKCSDETRAFQNHLINVLITQLEEKSESYI